ncbi:hypothetical protein AYO22_06813 [Fonsecaea multimorphosa]|nr:hypothetical protein AYO22_06813 [Fonsecaea multimorphosa]
MASKMRRGQDSEIGSGRGSEERTSSVPAAGGRGSKRARDNDLEKVSGDSPSHKRKRRRAVTRDDEFPRFDVMPWIIASCKLEKEVRKRVKKIKNIPPPNLAIRNPMDGDSVTSIVSIFGSESVDKSQEQPPTGQDGPKSSNADTGSQAKVADTEEKRGGGKNVVTSLKTSPGTAAAVFMGKSRSIVKSTSGPIPKGIETSHGSDYDRQQELANFSVDNLESALRVRVPATRAVTALDVLALAAEVVEFAPPVLAQRYLSGQS